MLYFLPEFLDTRPVGYEQQSAWLLDFGDGDVAANLGAPGYEWNTIKAYRASDGSYKIPKMVYPPSPVDPSRSVLITHPRKYSSADLHDPLDEWLSSTDDPAALDAASLMAGGQRLVLQLEPARVVSAGQQQGRVRQRVGHAAHLRRGRRVRVVPQARRRAGGRRRARVLRQERQRARRGRRAARARAAKLPGEDELRPVRRDWPPALWRLHREPGRRRRQPLLREDEQPVVGRVQVVQVRRPVGDAARQPRCQREGVPAGAHREAAQAAQRRRWCLRRGSSRAAPRPRASRRSRAPSSSRRRRGSRPDMSSSCCTRGSSAIKTASTCRRRAPS